ncbi:hypothetical protein BH23BAC2_BH23BAC2_14550 [soil metagenome]
MDTNNIGELFKDLDLDVAEPSAGHKERFLEKLKNKKKPVAGRSGYIRMLWSPIAGVAAALLIIFMIAGTSFGTLTNKGDLAGISPELKETHEFYTGLIKTEMARAQAANTPHTQGIFNDAILQMEKLDRDYEKLKTDLKNSGQDRRVVFAMISNLQQRIDILTNLMEQIEKIKDLKNTHNENNII